MAETRRQGADPAPGGFAGSPGSVLLRERSIAGSVNLRLDARDAEALAAVKSAIGVVLPVKSNTWAASGEAEVLWQAFDEWLIMTPLRPAAALLPALEGALSGRRHAVTDVSDQRMAFEISGPRSLEVLQKGCAVDLHPRAFGAFSCAQTALARVRVTLRRMNEPGIFQVLVERSYAQYLWGWLNDAAMEYWSGE